jgi:GxxExxY protein
MMRMLTDEEVNALTQRIIGCAYEVWNELRFGFLEKVYENAMVVALTRAGLKATQQQAIQVRFQGVVVGDYFADLLVEDYVVVELKSAKAIDESHKAQCINYLKATGMHVALLINFGPDKVEVKRFRN